MFSFSTVHLIAWACLIWNVTATPDNSGLELTQFKVKLDNSSSERFPRVLPVVLESPFQPIVFNFIKRDVDFNLPIYVQSKDKEVALLDTPPVKNVAFYTDERYDASVTLYCEENDPLFASPDACKEELMSGFFIYKGFRHVIKPIERIIKRFIIHLPGDLNKAFTQRHQVFKISKHNYVCDKKDERWHFSRQRQRIPQNIVDNDTDDRRRNRIKRNKQINIIEIVAVFTHTLPVDDEQIKKDKIYYMHVFWGIKVLLKNNPTKDLIFDVKLTAYALEPETSPLNVFIKKGGNVLDRDKIIERLMEFKKKHPCDHLTMFTKYPVSQNQFDRGLVVDDSMCSNKSVSLVSHTGNFDEIFHLTHELGHSLGANHDSVNNDCLNTTGFIMDERSIHNRKIDNAINSYKFSNCSLDAIRKFINSMKVNCLLFTGKSQITEYPVIPTGQLYPAVDQCTTNPNFTSICPFGRRAQTFCLLLFCSTKVSTCASILPAYKTTCGNKKWCIYGRCVYNANAPIADETCLYGDSQNLTTEYKSPNGTSILPKTCAEYLRHVPYLCNSNSELSVQCCDTCFKLLNPQVFPRKKFFPFLKNPIGYYDAAINLRSHFFLIASAVLHFFQQMENYFTS